MKNKPPRLVCQLTTAFDAWVVGSAADPQNPKPRDWDLIIPYSEWKRAAVLIASIFDDVAVNTFGGFKCKSGRIEVDVWPDDLTNYLKNARVKYAWHPNSGTRIVRVTG